MRKNKIILLSICSVLLSTTVFSQNRKIDSLLTLLKTDKEDTNKVNHLNNIALSIYTINPDSTILLETQAIALAQKLKFKRGESNAYSNAGIGYTIEGDYRKALDSYFKALKIDEETNNQNGQVKRYCNIGIVYKNQGDYPMALDYDFKGLKLAEKIGLKPLQAMILGNIGIVYDEQADYKKSLDYYFKSLKIHEELKNENGMAQQYSNIGGVYSNMKDYPKALDYGFKALSIAQEMGDEYGIAIQFNGIAGAYQNQGDSSLAKGNLSFATTDRYPKALDYYFKALEIEKELGLEQLEADALGGIGAVYYETKKYAESEKYLTDALKIDMRIGAINEERQFEEELSKVYSKTNRYELAFDYYKKAMVLKDSIFTKEKQKEITQKELTYDFEKKIAAQKAAQDKKDAIDKAVQSKKEELANEQLKEKEQQRNYFIVGFALVIVLAGFIFRSYKQKQKANEIITQQKSLVEEKQKEILDSIHYAKRIQKSLLPTEKYIDRKLNQLKKN